MSLLNKASLIQIPSGYKDGKLYSAKPIETLGSEVVTNGNFESNSDWSLGSGSTISGGSLNIVSAPYNANTKQTISLSTGTTYKISIDFTASGTATSNTFQLGFGDSAGNPTDTTQHEFKEGSDIKVLYVTAASGDETIIFRARDAGTSNLSIHSVSVRSVSTQAADFTFSRGSNLAATRVNNGLIEKGRENLLLQSNSFDTTWTVYNANTPTSGQTGYDGSSDAWLFESTANGGQLIQSVTYSGVNTLSIYAKQGSVEQIQIRFATASPQTAIFDLSTGSFVSSSGTIIDKTIESIIDGWYRVSLSVNATTGTQVNIYPFSGGSTTSGTIYIQDSQLESGLVATDYIETGASTAQAGILEDMPRLDYSGGATCGSLLLEPSRTQLVTQSEYFGAWNNARTIDTDNQATSPEGVVNAAYLEQQSGQTNAGSIYFGITFPSTSDYTTSIFAKKGEKDFIVAYDKNTDRTYFNLDTGTVGTTPAGVTASIEDFGNGWYRCSATFNTAAGGGNIAWYLGDTDNSSTVTDSGGVYIYGAMLEEGSYPTSYIPTYGGASVTRGEDVCVGGGDSSTFNDSEGVLFFEGSTLVEAGETRVISISNGSTSNNVYMNFNPTANSFNCQIIAGGSSQFDSSATMTKLNNNKIAIKYKANDFALWINGVEVATDTSGSTPTGLDRLNFDFGQGSFDFKGNVKQTIYFNTALSDDELEQLTTL